MKVAIIVGSRSDREVGEQAVEVLKRFGVEYDYKVLSAHRNPKELESYIQSSEVDVYIAIAGLSAALPGYIASRTIKPVIGVPLEVKLGGLDALLSMVQMPSGIPVACMGINNAKNAALLALQILALSDEKLKKALLAFRDGGSRL